MDLNQQQPHRAGSERLKVNSTDVSPNLAELKAPGRPETEVSSNATRDGAHPVLSFEELRQITSWNELKEIYQAKGLVFASDQHCLDAVKADWKLIRSIQGSRVKNAELPTEYPVETVLVDNKRIEIIGMLHSMAAHPDAIVLLRRKIGEYPLLLAEQNLGIMNGGIHSHGIDIPDHYVRGIIYSVIQHEWDQVRAVMNWVRKRIFQLRAKKTVRETVNEGVLDAQLPAAKGIAEFQQQTGHQDDLIRFFSRMSLMLPGDWGQALPANVDLAYRREKGLSYSMIQARSAYMAEFLKHWDIERTLSSCRHSISPSDIATLAAKKGFVCGQGHQPEIIFFLKNGVRDRAVAERARADAEVLNSKGPVALIALNQRKTRQFRACDLPFVVAKGLSIGWGISRLF